jgi:hypothetical protein
LTKKLIIKNAYNVETTNIFFNIIYLTAFFYIIIRLNNNRFIKALINNKIEINIIFLKIIINLSLTITAKR